jgi:hypothetical protein
MTAGADAAIIYLIILCGFIDLGGIFTSHPADDIRGFDEDRGDPQFRSFMKHQVIPIH